MTSKQLVEIHPRELKFTFEVKKQSSCAVRLGNITDQYVAFKVKTTSPKKYCVRPNIGVIKPNSTYDFTVTMQAQKSAPSDMICKDKFLIQSTVVPFGTCEEQITPGMFNKDDGTYIEECKLRVVLVSPPSFPVLQPANGIAKQDAPTETSLQQEKFPTGLENLPPAQTVVKSNKDVKFEEEIEEPRLGKTVDDVDLNFAKNTESAADEVFERVVKSNKDVKFEEETQEPRLGKAVADIDLNFAKNTESNADEVKKNERVCQGCERRLCNDIMIELLNNDDITLLLPMQVVENRKDTAFVALVEEPRFAKTVEDVKLNSPNNMESNANEVVNSRHLNMETTKVSLSKYVEELKSKINSLDSQLIKAEHIIATLKEDKRSTIKDMENLKQELALLKTKGVGKRAQVGFPPLFLCMVALICVTIGFLLRA